MPGTLYIVATPIGNLEDLTFRALRILREVDLVAAEDTRHSRKLFHHYGIKTPLTSYYEHNEVLKADRILQVLHEGKSVALISDAGTPGIADPGFRLVSRCREEGISTVAVPGPSAVIAALSVSGLPVDRFVFEGFLPAKTHARRQVLQRLRGEERTAIFYEAPHRLLAALGDIEAELGEDRVVAVARELTKLHEEFFLGTVAEASGHFGKEPVKGEIVLMVAPAAPEKPTGSVKEALRRWRSETDLPMREIVKQVAKEFGLPGSEVYRESLELKDEEGD
jgi:16S rRNA (cytidine1402-2'-O)-methyltransferase